MNWHDNSISNPFLEENMVTPLDRLKGGKNLCQKFVSNSQLKKLGVFVCGEAGRVGFEIKFHCFAKISFQFIHCISLGATAGKRRNFCPKSALISFVNHSGYFHWISVNPIALLARTATEESDGIDERDGAEPRPAWIAHAKTAKDAKPRQEYGAGPGSGRSRSG